MDEDDLQIDNIMEGREKKTKKVDGKAKGDRTELHLCKLFFTHFGVEFSRAPGSGSRGKQVSLPEHAKKTLTGDICVPEGFKWVIECKGGYEKDMNLSVAIEGSLPQLDAFIKQVSTDAASTTRRPIVCWKRNRKPWLAAIRCEDFPAEIEKQFPFRLQYGEWVMINLEKLLEVTDRSFWFEETAK